MARRWLRARGMTQNEPRDTAAWIFQCWTAFLVSFAISLAGIAYLPISIWAKGFVLLAYLFTVSSAFTLAKTIRDSHESKRLINRITEAKAERILREYEIGSPGANGTHPTPS
jgi:hypothetical protein